MDYLGILMVSAFVLLYKQEFYAWKAVALLLEIAGI
jgi:hypothetical protein